MKRKDTVKKLKAINVYAGGKLAEARINRGFKQTQLAKELGLSRASCVNMENGRQAMGMTRIMEAAIILNVEISHFFPTKDWYKEHKGKNVIMKISYEIQD